MSGRKYCRKQLGRFAWVMFVAAGASTSVVAADVSAQPSVGSSADNSVVLQEVVVTAQKREERLQDVPVPVTVLNATGLVSTNQLGLQDFYEKVPGLVVADGAQGFGQALSLDGIGNWGGGPTVSILLDDVPFGSSTVFGGAGNVPDIDPSDVSRIEVLHGPQGTLYGASSMGGLIKYVTLDPSTAGISGHLEAGTSSVYNGSELGYNVRGAVNLPLNDTMAVRASAFVREDPGYIDDVLTGKNGINEDHVYGGHLAALWVPSDAFSLKLNALVTRYRNSGWSDVSPNLGDLKTNEIRGTGGDYTQQAYSATAKAKLGQIDLTSITGYNIRHDSANLDYSYLAPFFAPGNGLLTTTATGTSKFTQEIRVSSTIEDRVDWLLGGFYTHEESNITQVLVVADPLTGGALGAPGYYGSNPTNYAELAGFADLTIHFTSRFDVQIGGRYSGIRQTTLPSYTTEPLFGVPGPITTPAEHASANPVTYLLTPRYVVSPDLMLYARMASGFRAGGYNLMGSCASIGYPCSFQPDKTKNYSVGAKGNLLDRLLSFDVSIFYIDWANFQISEVDLFSFITNAGKAKSQGGQFSVEAHPREGLTVAASFAYVDAVLTQALPVATKSVGNSGDDLPYNARYSGALDVKQAFPLSTGLRGFFAASIGYVGDRKGIFPPASVPRDDFRAYSKVDLRGGLEWSSWTANIYADNVLDRRGVLKEGISNFPSGQINYIRPRTIGLSVERKF